MQIATRACARTLPGTAQMHAVVYEVCSMASSSGMTTCVVGLEASGGSGGGSCGKGSSGSGGIVRLLDLLLANAGPVVSMPSAVAWPGTGGGDASQRSQRHAHAVPAYTFTCRKCGATVAMNSGEVAFFNKHSLILPKTCKGCKAARR